jgi:hypothetical protein
LKELQRVGKAGYIETPNAIFERLVPYDVHLLEIMDIEGKLLINKKTSARPDPFLNELDLIKHSGKWKQFFYGNPKLFHVRYLWKDEINFEVLNPDVSSAWFEHPGMPALNEEVVVPGKGGKGIRSRGLAALRKWHRLRKRNVVDLVEWLVCPECHGSLLINDEFGSCEKCQVSYRVRPVPDFNRPMTFETRAGTLRRVAQC